ncbi:MAG: transcriptional repressor of nrd s [Pseudomonadota bacterium]|uniref:Transcriptional repressor NrdR n=1 Tax=Candidatus Methylopumilus universalis TaxID=2588536 RepID=A0ABX5VUK6_9PROT|nr:transcriptional regulator NrdR [Candidatus Methylopumilus universalis]MBW0155921.1 transcriptional regulator NrdR [Candidatus Methylopumilus sp.]QDC45959.1 transcriptional repressor NrdR [Candidatus Methylopumilus universalis]QDC50960.1 transcriptional repressor NrdR [Candidatus Methylopumilus universalis]QDC61095.1 transcriptional repressor NrdR [Candidatus Methylopumilus universalis]QDC98859.1 transcriptional repressor NrdR [Candidatus Methylopumilus universalis]
MRCPFCGTDDTQVVDSRVNDEGNSIRRRRRCSECDKRFTTYESVELTLPQVVKQNGKREDFSRNKLHQSFSRALHKRPVPVEYIEQAIERIIQKVLAYGEKEITARELGENVMHELKKMDKVAYIRFASVYRSFSDVEDFHDVIRDLD